MEPAALLVLASMIVPWIGMCIWSYVDRGFIDAAEILLAIPLTLLGWVIVMGAALIHPVIAVVVFLMLILWFKNI